MTKCRIFAFISVSILACGLGMAPASAFQSAWVEGEGGAMRVVVTEGNETLPARGVLEIKLEPGWKTYWRNPGDGGIAPSLSSNGMPFELLFPAPERIAEGNQTMIGYHGSVSLPFIVPAQQDMAIDSLTAFIGVCSDICVPFEAGFEIKPDNEDAAFVEEAFAALPRMAAPGQGIVTASRTDDALMVTTESAAKDLFLAPEKGVYLGVPEVSASGFAIKIRKETAAGVTVHYTLTGVDGAISGAFVMPKS
jgi:DsbC/DsbD-like thiol-disulfide interchange protein